MNVPSKPAVSSATLRGGVRSIRRRCASVLIATAFLTVAGAVALHHQTAVQRRDALVINQSGRQRMLLNKTALFATETCLAQSKREQNAARDRMLQAVALFESSHEALLYGSDRIPPPEPDVRRLLESLDPMIREFIQHVRTLGAAPAADASPSNTDLPSFGKFFAGRYCWTSWTAWSPPSRSRVSRNSLEGNSFRTCLRSLSFRSSY